MEFPVERPTITETEDVYTGFSSEPPEEGVNLIPTLIVIISVFLFILYH